MTLREQIVKALAKSSGQNPVDLKALFKLGDEEAVQGELNMLYNENQVQTCSITRAGCTMQSWWTTGVARAASVLMHPATAAPLVKQRFCASCQSSHPEKEFVTAKGQRCFRSVDADKAASAITKKARDRAKSKRHRENKTAIGMSA